MNFKINNDATNEPVTSGYVNVETPVERPTIDVAEANNYAQKIEPTVNGLIDEVTRKSITYQNYDISTLKANARADINWKNLMLQTGLAMIIIFAFSFVGGFISSFGIIGAIIGMILSIGSLFVNSGIAAGLTQLYLDTKRKTATGNIFSRFDKLFPMLGFSVLVGLILIGLICIPIALLIVGVLFNKGVLVVIGALLYIPAIIFAVIFALKYNLGSYLIIDKDMGAIQAMKESKKLMKGGKGKLFALNISFIGWILLGLMFAGFMSALFGTLPTQFMESVSKIGVVIGAFNVVICILVSLLPISVYASMANVEFYETRVGNALNNRTASHSKGKIILSVVIISLILALVSSATMLLPFAKTNVPSSFNLGNLTFNVGKGNISFSNNVTLPNSNASLTSTNGSLLNSAWQTTNDGSVIMISEDGQYMWLQDFSVKTDNIIVGKFNQIDGEEAVATLSKFTNLGITEDKIREAYPNIDDLSIIVITEPKSIINGETQDHEFFVYLINEASTSKLVLTNLVNNSTYEFVPFTFNDASNNLKNDLKDVSNDSVSDSNKNAVAESPSDTTNTSGKLDITYTLPKGYKEEEPYISDYFVSISAMNDDFKLISIDENYDSDVNELDNNSYEEVQTYTTKNGISGTMGKNKSYEFYSFVFKKDNNSYSITSDTKEDLISIIESIK